MGIKNFLLFVPFIFFTAISHANDCKGELEAALKKNPFKTKVFRDLYVDCTVNEFGLRFEAILDKLASDVDQGSKDRIFTCLSHFDRRSKELIKFAHSPDEELGRDCAKLKVK